ncbi:unnamed protein product [Colias eurytheme]|nr:unnamed protein product [Colias eurytheme]
MVNILYLEANSSLDEYNTSSSLKVSIESLITYCVYKYCSPKDIDINFVHNNRSNSVNTFDLRIVEGVVVNQQDIPWQVASCVFPVVLYEDTIITGLCAVARHVSKYRVLPESTFEHHEGLLGFRKSCLQAPNEVSIWTKFCEVDIIKTVSSLFEVTNLNELPVNLVKFENHLHKPVRVHNIYKVARKLKKDNEIKNQNDDNDKNNDTGQLEKQRAPKPRKWKSNKKKNVELDCAAKLEKLDISHQFAEGPFLSLADILLLPSYTILMKLLGKAIFMEYLTLTYKWYNNLVDIPEMKEIMGVLEPLHIETLPFEELTLPETEDVSLYQKDPKRHNPRKRLFTKPEDIERALSSVTEDLELTVQDNNMDDGVDWDTIPSGANPSAGHLPVERVNRKSQQLENLTLAVTAMAKEGDLIVDFCSGSGHLGILIAHLLPKCTVILLENKEKSLLRARNRAHEMGLTNVYFFQCNLDFYIGKFDIGVALHACGIASDLVLDKCLQANAKFVLCPCCYGSLHATDRLTYPRSSKFKSVSIDQYLCIGHTADQTHKEHPLSVRGARCMAIIDSDRGKLAEEHGYKVTLSRLKPLSCTPKNNLLIGVPN